MKSAHEKTAARSRDWLTRAFFELLAQHPYDEITVGGIAERAQLSRRTFYRHFTEKDDLLDRYLESLFAVYTKLLLEKNAVRHEETLELFFTFWLGYADELRLLQKRGLFGRVLRAADVWYPEIYGRLQMPWHGAETSKEISYASAFGAGGYFNILSLWVAGGCGETPRELVRIVGNILAALSRSVGGSA